MREEGRTANRFAALSLAAALLLQSLVAVYYYGRLSERVDSVQHDTRILLDLQLQKKGELK